MPNRIVAAQVSDTTDDDSSNEADKKRNQLSAFRTETTLSDISNLNAHI